MSTTTETTPEVSFGLPLDPLKPAELQVPPGFTQTPPACPDCEALLHPANNNHAGDVLFECMNDGYMAVYRIASKTWEQRPGFVVETWKVPLIAGQKKPTKAATVETVTQSPKPTSKRGRRKA